MFKNLILDWSGTLADDLAAVIAGTNHVFAQFGRPGFDRAQFRAVFRLPYRDFYAEHLPGVGLPEIDEWYRAGFEPMQEAIPLLPEAHRFLARARETGRRLFVLSSVAPLHFEAQARRLGVFDYFEEICAGVHDKREGLLDLLARRGLQPDETAMIGDMVHDVEAARAAGVHAIALLSGYDDATRLAAAGPDFIAPHIGALAELLLPPRPAAAAMPVATVGALIFNEAGELLLLRSAKWSNKWGIPGGKIRRGERMEAALRREIGEETGLELEEVQFVAALDCVDPVEFVHPAHFILLGWSARVSGATAVRLNDEAEDFRWASIGTLNLAELNAPSGALFTLWMEASTGS